MAGVVAQVLHSIGIHYAQQLTTWCARRGLPPDSPIMPLAYSTPQEQRRRKDPEPTAVGIVTNNWWIEFLDPLPTPAERMAATTDTARPTPAGDANDATAEEGAGPQRQLRAVMVALEDGSIARPNCWEIWSSLKFPTSEVPPVLREAFSSAQWRAAATTLAASHRFEQFCMRLFYIVMILTLVLGEVLHCQGVPAGEELKACREPVLQTLGGVVVLYLVVGVYFTFRPDPDNALFNGALLRRTWHGALQLPEARFLAGEYGPVLVVDLCKLLGRLPGPDAFHPSMEEMRPMLENA